MGKPTDNMPYISCEPPNPSVIEIKNDRLTELEKRVEKLEATKARAALLLQRIAELVKGVGSKLAELTELFKN